MKNKILLFLILILAIFSIKVNAYELNKDSKIYVSGQSIGIKLNTGVEVLGTYGVVSNKDIVRPWDECKIREGDIITKLDNNIITSSNDLLNIIKKSNGKKMKISYLRGNEELNGYITPILNDNSYTLGLYIKDTILGVGTLTYYISDANIFGSLGHMIYKEEYDDGLIYEAKVTDIIMPKENRAGEKKASVLGEAIGKIEKNTNTGIHGYANNNINTNSMVELQFKTRDEINLGKAEIWTCVDGLRVEKYDIEIISLESQDKKDIKGITFKVVDDDLINKAGGIIQGMSGSPIIQDEKIIGAVTHVSIKDAKIGYGIYLEWMFSDMDINIK